MGCWRREFIGIFTEPFTSAVNQSLDKFISQASVVDGYCTCAAEQSRIAASVKTEKALCGAEVDLLGLAA